MKPSPSGLADELAQERATLERELAEIDLLLRQTTTEAERHEARRVQAEERLATLEQTLPPAPEPVAQARLQLLNQTRRATMMEAQLEVLSGKQRALQRYAERLSSTLPTLNGTGQNGSADSGGTGAGAAPGAASSVVLAAQEHLRREIARQMHDGPAQSIANIALQAHIVQRLFERQPERANAELDELVRMVQQALEATKDFIFDVRPMVLDDLGLVPTLRRTCVERSRRGSVAVRFESDGTDRRLPTELESALFRIIDDALTGFLAHPTPEVLVRLDWSQDGLRALVQGRPTPAEVPPEAATRAAVADARRQQTMPAALATMIREQQQTSASSAWGLAAATWHDIEQRAAAAGIKVSLTDSGAVLEAIVEPSR